MKLKYKEQQKEEHLHQMNQVSEIKKLEHLVQAKKREHQYKVQEYAKERYENQVKVHEDARNNLENEISRLEQREIELMNRLKTTQTHHQAYVEDLDRIINNEEPLTLKLDKKEKTKVYRR